jgi:hypothetical protein
MNGTARVAACAALAALAAAADYEGPRTFKASEVLKPAQVKGAHFSVAPDVPTEGYFHLFRLTTDYGSMEAEGRSMLLKREHETGALAQLEEVSKTGVFVKAAGNSVLNVGKGVSSAVSDPEATAKGLGAGVKRFGTNLGRKAKRTADQAVDSTKGGDDKAQGSAKSTPEKAADAGTGMAYSVLGVNSGARRWAQKLGVDPYTTNPVLKKALTDIGKIDAAGGIAAKVAVPIPMVVSGTATVGNLVWGKDPEELLKLNEAKLRQIGVKDDVIKQLYLSKGFTLSLQTRFAQALSAVNVKGCADYAAAAAESATEREAMFFTESAEMLDRLNRKAGVSAVLEDSRAMVAKTKDGRAVVLLPVDWVRWTEPFDKASAEVARRAKAELGAARLELQTTARLSAAAEKELTARGFSVTENLPYSFELAQARATTTGGKPADPKPAPKK